MRTSEKVNLFEGKIKQSVELNASLLRLHALTVKQNATR